MTPETVTRLLGFFSQKWLWSWEKVAADERTEIWQPFCSLISLSGHGKQDMETCHLQARRFRMILVQCFIRNCNLTLQKRESPSTWLRKLNTTIACGVLTRGYLHHLHWDRNVGLEHKSRKAVVQSQNRGHTITQRQNSGFYYWDCPCSFLYNWREMLPMPSMLPFLHPSYSKGSPTNNV